MAPKIILDRQELEYKYKKEKLSQRRLAEYYGCSIDTIVANLQRYNISSNSNGDYVQQKIFLNEKQIEWLNGLLLGDGCLSTTRRGKNAQLRYTSKSKQHVDFATAPFANCEKAHTSYTEYADSRTQNTYSRWVFGTAYDKGFKIIYNKWYENGKKHIPSDLQLTPTVCLLWYIGDGCLLRSKYSSHIKLSTHCFDKNELENILLPQLVQFDAHIAIAGYSKYEKTPQYYIYIPRHKVAAFLQYIGPCPFDDYAYKWNYVEYKNTPPRNHTSKENEICNMYLSGVTYCKIAKHMGMDPAAVRYYLKKNKIYQSGGLNNEVF